MFDFIYNLQFYLQNVYFYLQFAIWFSIKTKKANMYEIKSRWPHSLKAVINIGKLQNLLRVVFIDEECGNLKIVIDVGKLTRNKSSHWKLSRKKVCFCLGIWGFLDSTTAAENRSCSAASEDALAKLGVLLKISLCL